MRGIETTDGTITAQMKMLGLYALTTIGIVAAALELPATLLFG